ncbi:Rab3 GTPase-activating protein catalytic subunit [Podila humilis]|nr:Rab3 GTPase-activating protein catalytic subunit [Podila humilis]
MPMRQKIYDTTPESPRTRIFAVPFDIDAMKDEMEEKARHRDHGMDDFENFEFIDYTTSGPWERFITQIEDSLRSWGLVNQSLGVFDAPAAPVETSPEEHTSTTTGDKSTTDSSQNSPSSPEKSYQFKEMLSLDDATYAFSYHYHPARAKVACGFDGIDLEFLPIKLDGIHHHSLHRWTSLTHFLVISPVTISDIFASSMASVSSSIIDLSSAKLLLSSFAIAFQNTGCSIPVFVPTGQPWNLTFTGLSIQQEHSQLYQQPLQQHQQADTGVNMQQEDIDDEQGIEVRFNTVLIPYPPVQQTYLPGILDIFIQRMGIEDPEPAKAHGSYSEKLKSLIQVSALFSYDLVNWYDEDWRWWKSSTESANDSMLGASDMGPLGQNELSKDIMNMDDIKIESRTASSLPTPVLPFGPVQDPLESLRLYARFAPAPCAVYLDNRNFSNMDACNANIWVLRAAFKRDDVGILSGILEEAIASWSSDVLKNSRRTGNSGRSDEDTIYGPLLSKGAQMIHDNITLVDTVDVDNIIESIFDMTLEDTSPSVTRSGPQITSLSKASKRDRLLTAAELGLQFRHATTVPYQSFLWKMVQHLLSVISPNSEISYATSVIGFLKVLWSELLKKLYQHWEESQLVPLIDIYGCEYTNSLESTSSDHDELERKPVAIDLRYNLLHQKLSMLNCCIARQIARNKEAPGHIHAVERSPKNNDDSTFVPGLSLSNNLNDAPTTNVTEPQQTYGAQLHSLLHGLSDISRPRSADVVPMAKKFLKSVKRRGRGGVVAADQTHSREDEFTESTESLGPTSRTEPSSPAPVPIPGEKSFRRSQSGSDMRRQFSTSSMGHSERDDGEDDDVFYDPMEQSETPSRTSNPPFLQRRTHSLTESYVALKFSSSVDSQSGVLVDNLDQTSVVAHGPDPREVSDATKSEGGLKPLKDLKLLETGAPLMIPKLQEPGYMTDDMIQQQEELFETLGSSSEAAKMRAKMQSTQLISDMEAFKAANPGCVLGDFIRWHSPKDWVEDKNQMSARMMDAGNYWQELWANSKRIPVCRQTPLFNHNQEAAKVLFFLDGLSANQLFIHFLPTMCLIAYDTLVSHPVAGHIPRVERELKDLGRQLALFPWGDLTSDDDLELDQVVERFRKVELLMGRAIALIRKFPDQYDLVGRILAREETVVEDGQERESVYEVFCVGGSPLSSFPQPTTKEFVLQTSDPAPDSSTVLDTLSEEWAPRPMMRRMYACFKDSEARIVETIAKDGVYM